ncbi:MAG: alpha/beta fold hydrolase [Pseudomonadota bacterium]
MKIKKGFYCIGIFTVLLLCCPGHAQAASYPPMAEALAALKSDNDVTVTTHFMWSWLDVYYAFEPADRTPAQGFIFYPGGKVDPRAYAPLMHALAEKGYVSVIASMPADLAVLGYKRADAIMRKFPGIKKWAIGGHSLGGVMACRYAKDFTDKIDGVVLWASYPSATFSLAEKSTEVISISGSKDGLSTPAKITNSHNDLPADTQFVVIDGGNHTQFGWYGNGSELQKGDNPADITRENQQEQIVEATAGFLEQLK